MTDRLSVVGQTINRWTVTGWVTGSRPPRVEVTCQCGTVTTALWNNIKRGLSKGCYQCRPLGRNATHGLTGSTVWKKWASMIQRCHNPNNPSFHNYGARGIYVCERWRESVANYYADMGDPPEGGMLERIDNDGPYSPDNCRWATRLEQNSNTRKNVYVEYEGRMITLSEASRITGINHRTLGQRHGKGWRGERLFSAPER